MSSLHGASAVAPPATLHPAPVTLHSPPSLSRRGLLTGAGSALTLALLVRQTRAWGAPEVVRPPGSVPEDEFLRLCVRCGECFQVCPNNVLQPMGFERGLEHLWTPRVAADWSGCDASCNRCGQVCPTGAIRALPLAEKHAARMGLAVIDPGTCLPHAGRAACRMCVDECAAAGYHALEFMRVRVELDENGLPVEESGFAAPVVLRDLCVGCGLCQSRCYHINVQAQGLLRRSAIVVVAGRTDCAGGRETGS